MFKAKKKETIYSNKSFNKIVINFIGIEIAYLKCNLFFLTKLKLHKYIIANYIKKTLFALFP